MNKIFGVFLFTLGFCTAAACGLGTLSYLIDGAILETAMCIFGTAAGAAVTCAGSQIIDF